MPSRYSSRDEVAMSQFQQPTSNYSVKGVRVTNVRARKMQKCYDSIQWHRCLTSDLGNFHKTSEQKASYTSWKLTTNVLQALHDMLQMLIMNRNCVIKEAAMS